MTQAQNQTDLEEKLKKAKEEADKREGNSASSDNTGTPPGASATNGNGDDTGKLQEELNNMTEMARRAMADLQNLKRRHEEERSQIIIFANTRLISEILPILDNLDRAKQHIPKELETLEAAKEWLKGLDIAINQLHQSLNAAGVKAIESVGQTFNPDMHEAVVQASGEKDKIIEEFEKGYTLNDKVIRHAKVKVGNGEKN